MQVNTVNDMEITLEKNVIEEVDDKLIQSAALIIETVNSTVDRKLIIYFDLN